jgi:hypothetical protein
MKEPVLFLVIGGQVLVQATLQTLIAFGVPIGGSREAAISSLAAVVIGILTRMQVTPVASLKKQE